jgi:hypothetical protein
MLMVLYFRSRMSLAAHTLAVPEQALVSYPHLEIGIGSGKEFGVDFRGGKAANDQSSF